MPVISLILFFAFVLSYALLDKAYPIEKRTSLHYLALVTQFAFSVLSLGSFFYFFAEGIAFVLEALQ